MDDVCDECHFRGLPVVFDDDAAYLAFRAGVRGPPGAEATAAAVAARADRELEEVLRTPAPPIPEGLDPGLDLLDRLRVVPVMAFLGGFAFTGSGLLNVASGLSDPDVVGLASAVGGALQVLIGAALLAVGRRSWRRLAARAAGAAVPRSPE